jgi:ketosteroid isomerase-like protein
MNPEFAALGQQFVGHYYPTFDADRSQLVSLYNESSVCTYEGTQIMGRDAIMQHLTQSLTFQTVRHLVTLVDAQPLVDGGVLVQVVGQLQADADPAQSFTQTFLLRADAAGGWFVAHDIFRLVLHNG